MSRRSFSDQLLIWKSDFRNTVRDGFFSMLNLIPHIPFVQFAESIIFREKNQAPILTSNSVLPAFPRASLDSTPADVLMDHLAPFLEDRELAALDCSFKHCHSVFSTGALKVKKQAAINELLLNVVQGNQEEVEKIIKRRPFLLLESGSVTDLSGRSFEDVTALMLAAGAGDADILSVITKALDKHAPAEKIKQYRRQFPAGEEKNEQQREAEGVAAITRIFEVIKKTTQEACELILENGNAIPMDNKYSEEAQQLLTEMYKYRHHWEPYGYYVLKLADDEKELQTNRLYVTLKAGGFAYTVFDPHNHLVSGEIFKEELPALKDLTAESDLSLLQPHLIEILKITAARGHTKSCPVIQTSSHFPLMILIKLFELYDKYSHTLEFSGEGQMATNPETPKNMLCWQQVVGYPQRALPAWMAQIFAQGAYRVFLYRLQLWRSFDFDDPDNHRVFPLDERLDFLLGYNVALNPVRGFSRTCAHSTVVTREMEIHIKEKQQQCRELCTLGLGHDLLQHIVRGNLAQAKFMIEKNPALLLFEDEIETDAADLQGNKVRVSGTPFRLFLAQEDMEGAAFCAELLDKHYPYVDEKNPGEKVKQFREQFPIEEEKNEIARQERDSDALNKTIAAIFNSSIHACQRVLNNEEEIAVGDGDIESQKLLDALNAFRNYVKPKEVIKTGKHFNMQLLIKAFKFYEDSCRAYGTSGFFGGFHCPKANLYWKKVIHYLMRFLPAYYAQIFTQGLYMITYEGRKLHRSNGSNKSFFPLDLNPNVRLGYNDSFPVPHDRGFIETGLCKLLTPSLDVALEKLYQTNTAAIQSIMQPCSQSQRQCLVM